ncbi:hypothetical protein THICB1_180032 [Thiomonas arsenitoxydans]|uniref:Uncharacterized protein n=1 Tax=Thiomonas arsenitoxydans (strain DSM 22701 / CIP 110005 / 3As) TaxID=426114 RepID=A0ABM9T420_THIA3|nr:hypothetical protein THICB2_390015 [Thiomonas sp. CB2]CQR31708.1 hypothetical protein THICB1_180032 [Thiomonas arsenitoxydans]
MQTRLIHSITPVDITQRNLLM